MVDLVNKLKNILKIVSTIATEIKIDPKRTEKANILTNSVLESNLRSLNFEANEFFENLTEDFNINNDIILKIINIVSDTVERNLAEENNSIRDICFNLLNFEYYLVTHLLFVLSSQNIVSQAKNASFFSKMMEQLVFLDYVPSFPINSLEDKKELDDYLRLLGSAGDLQYLACANLQKINKEDYISWASKCFHQFQLLDETIKNYNPLNFHYKNQYSPADLYRDLIGYYTIIGNTNATNLLEHII